VLFLKAIREILVNVIKHAKAQIVEVCIRTEADDIIVEIKDDGIGFDVPAVPRISSTNQQGLGIFTIRERLSHLKGHFSIASKPGQGTCVTLTMPIQKEAAEENS
jgi:two-component system sensor histidine kinase ComP